MNNLQQLPNVDYGLYLLAKVVFNSDPQKKQRIKVEIPNLLEGEPDTLPWLSKIGDGWLGYGATFGRMEVPPVGAWVTVKFEGGDLSYGKCVGSTPVAETNLGPLETNYPFRYGFRDPAGNYFYTDTTTGSVDVEFHHKSGTSIHIADNGALTLNVANNETITVNGNLSTTVTGNMSATVSGNMSATVSGAATFAVSGSITSSGSAWTHTGAMNLIGLLTVTGAMKASGSITDTYLTNTKTMSDMRTEYNIHTHVSFDGGGTTTVPTPQL